MKNVTEAVVMSYSDMLSRVTTRREDEQTIAICRSVAKWLVEMTKRSEPQRFLCLDCDTSFHARRMPEAFAVTLPFLRDGERSAAAALAGICRHCAEKGNGALLQKFVERLRVYYPDLTIIESGQA
jgi:hypothetical protein